MQGYKKPRTFGRRKNLITVILISLVMVGIAVYFTLLKQEENFSKESENTAKNSETVKETEQNAEIPLTEESDTDTEEPANTEPSEQPEETPLSFIWPCDALNIGQEYSGLVPVFSETLQDWRAHPAVDIITEAPENVYAAADGTIEDVYKDGLMGNTVLIQHSDHVYTIYQSLDENPKVLKNMEVKKGDLIGKTGSSAVAEETLGVHLHFAMIENGNNCDPASYIEPNAQQPESPVTE